MAVTFWNTLSHFWSSLSNADKINFTIALCTGQIESYLRTHTDPDVGSHVAYRLAH